MWAALVLSALLLPNPSPPPQLSRLSEAQRVAIIQSLISSVGIARQNLPTDKKGVEISSSGQILNQDHVAGSLEDHGRAAKPGDRVAITAIVFKSDRIEFALNGGPHTTHWYDHVSIGMGGGTQPVSQPSQNAARGSMIVLRFPHQIPSLTPEQVKLELNPLIDWDRPAEAEMMVKPIPAPVKAAIKAHHVLVGMTTDMVVAAVGRTGNKTRQTDASGNEYADWVYGEPPAATTFVRIQNDRVIRVITYEPDGKEIVETKVDPALAGSVARQQQSAAATAAEADQPPPTLRRPGDAPPEQAKPGAAPAQNQPLPGLPPNASPDSFPTAPGSLPSHPGSTLPGGPPGTPPTTPPVCCGGGAAWLVQ